MVYFTTTPKGDKKHYRRVMDRMWQILATRVTIIDEVQFQQVFAQMEMLEITTGCARHRQIAKNAAGRVERQRRPKRANISSGPPQPSESGAILPSRSQPLA